MTTTPGAGLPEVATECVTLVAAQYGRELDYSLDSLTELDAVCGELLADGPLSEERLDLWWKLIGAYTGEVLLRVYGGEWITPENGGAPGILIEGTTGFPFVIADRVLRGEPFKSIGSFGRALPVIIERSRKSE